MRSIDYHIVSIYPVATSPMRRQILDTAILVAMYFLVSVHQITVDVIVGRIKASHIINAVCIGGKLGIPRMMQASPITIRSVAINSVTKSFHIHFVASSISFWVKLSFPWWIRIQIFPKSGPCQMAPSPKQKMVIIMIAVQLSPTIRKKKNDKRKTCIF